MQEVSPADANVSTGHAAQLSWLVALHGALTTEPAPHPAKQAVHGEVPDALHVEPTTHDERTQVLLVAFQE